MYCHIKLFLISKTVFTDPLNRFVTTKHHSWDQDSVGGRGVNRSWSRGSSAEPVGRKKFGRGRGVTPKEVDISLSSSDISDDGLADLQIQDHEESDGILLPPQQRLKNLFPGLSNKVVIPIPVTQIILFE